MSSRWPTGWKARCKGLGSSEHPSCPVPACQRTSDDVGDRTEKRPLGKQVLDGEEIDLPPLILGQYGTDPAKKTILLYGECLYTAVVIIAGTTAGPLL